MFRTLFQDDFSTGGWDPARWRLAGDGVTRALTDGVRVIPTGSVGDPPRPAFSAAAERPGADPHLRWTAVSLSTASSGVPGFEVPSRGTLSFSAHVSGGGTRVGDHPFGDAVEDPESDVRLGAAAVVAVDLATRCVFDFALTASRVYAVYERLPAREPGAGAAFTYAVPVAERDPERRHECGLAVDRGGRRARWLLDGREVLALEGIGQRCLDRTHLLLDDGKEAPRVPLSVDQLACGFALLDFLDGAGPDGSGLLPWTVAEARSIGAELPRDYACAAASDPGLRHWGQGAQLELTGTQVRLHQG